MCQRIATTTLSKHSVCSTQKTVLLLIITWIAIGTTSWLDCQAFQQGGRPVISPVISMLAPRPRRHRSSSSSICKLLTRIHPRVRITSAELSVSALHANVASELARDSIDGNDNDDNDDTGAMQQRKQPPQRTLSTTTTTSPRSERKALERERKFMRKNSNHRKHNFAQRRQDWLRQEEQERKKSGQGEENEPPENKGTSSSTRSFALHSNAVKALTLNSSADDVMRAIKRAQNLHDDHDIRNIGRFLMEQTDSSFAYGYRGSLLSRLAVAALHLNNQELARKAMDMRIAEHKASLLPMESAALIRGLLRVHNVSDALHILETELALPSNSATATAAADPSNNTNANIVINNNNVKDRIKYRALSLASVISRHFFEGEPSMAVLACGKLAEVGNLVRQEASRSSTSRSSSSTWTAEELQTMVPWNRILAGAAECEAKRRQSHRSNNGTAVMTTAPSTSEGGESHSNQGVLQDQRLDVKLPCNLVYSVLNAMMTFPSANDDYVYELLSNALIRRVVFVTGAISMDGCPKADRGEAVFIGRSNVGKSSLINMLTNRKSLAFTSKRPGKTQQFNFFAVNDKPGLEKEIKYGDVVEGCKDLDSFYLVDVPGFGYAKVPEKLREQWKSFLQEYISTRNTLRCVFHLIDSRLGPTEEDLSIMKQMSVNLPRSVVYAIVLTKADKNVKLASNKNPGKVSADVMKAVRQAMKDNGAAGSPVILSSAETRLGRDDLWRYLRLAAEG